MLSWMPESIVKKVAKASKQVEFFHPQTGDWVTWRCTVELLFGYQELLRKSVSMRLGS